MTRDETIKENQRQIERRGRVLPVVGVLAVLLLSALVIMLWSIIDGRQEAEDGYGDLADRVTAACADSEAATELQRVGACQVAEEAPPAPVDQPDPDDPDPDDPEDQDPETQGAEEQNPEQQDPEIQDGEQQDSDPNDPDPTDDPDPNDPEIQDPEEQEPEIQDPEEQNAPTCPDGFTQEAFVWNGPDSLPATGDERTWVLCMGPPPE